MAAALARARRYLAEGNSAKAEDYLRACSHFAGHNADYFHLLGLWHELNDRQAEALAAYRQAAQFDQQHGPASEALGRLSAGPDSAAISRGELRSKSAAGGGAEQKCGTA